MFDAINRINPASGEREKPWRNRSHEFALSGPSSGVSRYSVESESVLVDNYGEAVELVRQGYSIRLSDGRSPPTLVSPRSLVIEVGHVKGLDDLWTYTMPAFSPTRSEVEEDIRASIAAIATEIAWIASAEISSAFAGALYSAEVSRIEAGAIDLSRFNFTRVVLAAHASAFRTTNSLPIDNAELNELEILIGGTFSGALRRYPNPVDDQASALRRTMLCAYWRRQISEGRLFENDLVDASIVEKLAVLSNMTEQAVRNSLNKNGLSSIKGRLDYAAIIRWLENRRDFVPLREQERPGASNTSEALHLFETLPQRDALPTIAARLKLPASVERTQAEQAIIDSYGDRLDIPDAVLRQYARSANLLIDTFVLNYPQSGIAAA